MNTTVVKHPTTVPASAVLSAWQAHDWRDGVSIDQLSVFDRLTIETRHSVYEIVVIAAGSAEILVRGGTFFPVFTPARLSGSSLGGSFLKLRSVNVGFSIEIAFDQRVIVTSPVRTISVASAHNTRDVM